jgi:hypothetical protein
LLEHMEGGKGWKVDLEEKKDNIQYKWWSYNSQLCNLCFSSYKILSYYCQSLEQKDIRSSMTIFIIVSDSIFTWLSSTLANSVPLSAIYGISLFSVISVVACLLWLRTYLTTVHPFTWVPGHLMYFPPSVPMVANTDGQLQS